MSILLAGVVLYATAVPSAPLPGRQPSDAGLKLVQAEVSGGYLYALVRVTIDPVHSRKEPGTGPRLVRSLLTELDRGTAALETFNFFLPGVTFHWRMAAGCFWADNPHRSNGIYRISQDDFPPPKHGLELEEYRRRYARKWPDIGCSRPEEVRTALGGNIGFAVELPFEAWYHFMPTGKDTSLFFLRRESDPANPEERGPDVVEVYRGDGGPIKEEPYKGRFWFDWEKIESFPAAFRGDFQVRHKDGDYYLILESGQVYLARKPAKGQQRKLEEVWGKDRPPITAILTDSDNDQVYLFGKAKQKEGKPFFFPLSAKPQVKEFNAEVFTRGPVDEPLRSAFGMARAAGLAKEPPRERVPAPRP